MRRETARLFSRACFLFKNIVLVVGATMVIVAFAGPEPELRIGFKSHVLLSRGDVKLGQLVQVQGSDQAAVERLQTLVVTLGALPAAMVSISKERILSVIAKRAPDLLERIRWQGTETAGVRVAVRHLDLPQLESEAEDTLRLWLSARFQHVSVKALTSVRQAPAIVSDAEITFRPVKGPVRSRMIVWVDVTQDGLPIQSMPLWFAVSALQAVCVANRSMPSRAEISSRDMVVRVIDVAPYAGRQITDPREVMGHITIAPLSAGDVITRDGIRDSYDVEAGDDVALRLQQGGLTLQTHGVALESGQQGQSIGIRFPKSGAMTVARIIGRDRVEVLP